MVRESKVARVAAELRDAIARGDYPPGAMLPHGDELAGRFGAHRGTVYAALRQLAAEGLVTVTRHGGTTVRQLPEPVVIERDRGVMADERGYFFDAAAKHWTAARAVVIGWRVPPADVGDMIGTGPGEVLCRDRAMGPPGGPVLQLAASWIPRDVAEAAGVTGADTGPGGIYARFEDHGHAPLAWAERVGARMPTPGEAAELGMRPGVPVLRVLRSTHSRGPRGRVLEVCEVRLPADRWAVSYRLRRG